MLSGEATCMKLSTSIYLLLISNTHGVFQPIESDAFNETNPGSNKAVPVGQMKGGDKVLSIVSCG